MRVRVTFYASPVVVSRHAGIERRYATTIQGFLPFIHLLFSIFSSPVTQSLKTKKEIFEVINFDLRRKLQLYNCSKDL